MRTVKDLIELAGRIGYKRGRSVGTIEDRLEKDGYNVDDTVYISDKEFDKIAQELCNEKNVEYVTFEVVYFGKQRNGYDTNSSAIVNSLDAAIKEGKRLSRNKYCVAVWIRKCVDDDCVWERNINEFMEAE